MSSSYQNMPRLSDRMKQQIRELSTDGWGHRRIAAALGLAASTVARVRYHLGLPANSVGRPTNKPTGQRRIEFDSGEEAVRLYRLEKAKAEERKADLLTPAKAQYAQLLEREREAGRGGRPKKSFGTLPQSKPGKPNIYAKAVDPRDALIESLGHFGGGA